MDNNRDNNRDPNRPEQGPGKQGPNKNHQSILAFLICLIVTLVCFSLFTNMLKDGSSEITYDKFIEMVEKDQIKEVILEVGSEIVTIVPKNQKTAFQEQTYYTNQMEDETALTKRLE